MVSDPPPAPAAGPSVAEEKRVREKVRIRFRKGGDLRFLSHHDLARTFERMLRRADLPVHATQGFHPKPRLIFALSLPLGVVGCAEVAELELDRPFPPEDVQQHLARQAPPGLEILSVTRIDPRAGAQVRSLCYRLPVPTERTPSLAGRITSVLAAPDCLVERTRPPRRRLDLRPFLRHLALVQGTDGLALEMDLWLTPAGTARPEEVLSVLGIHDLFEAGVILERTRLELHDEVAPPLC